MRYKEEDIHNANNSPDSESWHNDPYNTGPVDAYTPIDPDYFVMMTMDEVAALVRMSPRTIKRLVYKAQFPEPVQLSVGREAFRKNQVLEFLAGKRSFPIF